MREEISFLGDQPSKELFLSLSLAHAVQVNQLSFFHVLKVQNFKIVCDREWVREREIKKMKREKKSMAKTCFNLIANLTALFLFGEQSLWHNACIAHNN